MPDGRPISVSAVFMNDEITLTGAVPSDVAGDRLLALSGEYRLTPASIVNERSAAGWMQGAADGGRKTHLSMVAWSELSDAEKEKDRQAVRDLPRRLERGGFAVVRG